MTQQRRPIRDTELSIVVLIPGKGERVVSGRVARMIVWLCDNQRSVDSVRRGRVDVSFSGDFQEWHITETRVGY